MEICKTVHRITGCLERSVDINVFKLEMNLSSLNQSVLLYDSAFKLIRQCRNPYIVDKIKGFWWNKKHTKNSKESLPIV
jgi:hypothetical protein